MSDIELHRAPPAASTRSASLPEKVQYAQQLAAADLLPGDYRKKPGNVLLAVEYGDMLDVHPLTAIQQVHVIKGKLTMSAELMRAQVQRHGHRFRTVEMTSDRAVVSITRSDDPEHTTTVEFSIADAKAAGLMGNDTWQKFPKSMLHARATSMAVRAVCPEVLMGISYTPEEVGGVVDPETGEVIDVAEAAAQPMVLATQDQVDRILAMSAELSDEQKQTMRAYLDERGWSVKQLTPGQAGDVIARLESLVGVAVADGAVEAEVVEPPAQVEELPIDGDEHARLVRKMHALAGKAWPGRSNDAKAQREVMRKHLLGCHGVESSNDLTVDDLDGLCRQLEDIVEGRAQLKLVPGPDGLVEQAEWQVVYLDTEGAA